MTKLKKLTAVFLSLLMLLSLLPFAAIAKEITVPEGTGTKTDPYVIMTAEQLIGFSEEVNNGYNFEGEYIVLGADIDLDGCYFEPIGNGLTVVEATADQPEVYAEFSGNFDGKGHTVSNVYIERDTSSSIVNQLIGLFGVVYGTVKNLTVADSYFCGYSYIGAVAAVVEEDALIENCHSKNNKVLGDYCVGGVVGSAIRAQIKDCTNSSSVLCEDYGCGGVVGDSLLSEITDCINFGVVNSYEEAGGIAGAICGSTVKNCANLGSVMAEDENCGGIVGYFYNRYDSGIMLLATDSEETEPDQYSYIENCYNGGTVTSGDQEAGGIAGDGEYVKISNCYNAGKVSAIENAGGIVGEMNNGIVKYCVNVGELSAQMHVGGIVANVYYEAVADEMPVLEEMVHGCYYLEGNADFAVDFIDYFDVDDIRSEIAITEEVEGNAFVSEDKLLDKTSYPKLDFDEYWEIGNKNAQLQYFSDVYRMYVPSVDEDAFDKEEVVLGGTVKVLGVELKDGEYLANGATEATTETPSVGYAYFKNNKLYLNNFYYSGEGALYGVAKYVILTYDNIEIVLVGNNTIDFQVGEYTQMPVAIAHSDGGDYDGFTVVYSGEGTLNINTDAQAIFANGNIIVESGNFNITSYDNAIFTDNLTIYNGNFKIKSNQDSIGVNSDLTIHDGIFNIKSNNDAIVVESNIYIADGKFDIYAEFEAIEAYYNMYIYNGEYTIRTYDGAGIYSDDTIVIYDGIFDIKSEYGNSIYAYYDMYIYDGEFDLYTEYTTIYVSYYDLYIYGGDFNIESNSTGIYACECVYIENAAIDIYADYEGVESCCGCDVIIKNSDIKISAETGIDSDYSTLITDSVIEIDAYEAIWSEYDVSIKNSEIISESYYFIEAKDSVSVENSMLEIYSEYGIYVYTGEYESAVLFKDSEVIAETYGYLASADFVSFDGGTSDIYSDVAFVSHDVEFLNGTHTINANVVVDGGAYTINPDILMEEIIYSDFYGRDVLYIKPINNATPDEIPPEELPEEETPEEPVVEKIIYVGGVEMKDGDYLASGASGVMSVAPSRGGYAYYKDGILTLNNYKYYGEGYEFSLNPGYSVNSLILSEIDLEICLIGENIVSNTSSVGDGITIIGNLAINGEGTLDIISTYGIYSYGDSVTVDAIVNIDAENIGVKAEALNVNSGVLSVNGTPALKADVVLGKNMEFTTGDETSNEIVIEYVEPKKPDDSKPDNDKPGEDKPGEDKPGDDKPGEDKPDNGDKDETPKPPVEEEYMPGDINGNKEIDSLDYILIKRAYFGTYKLTEEQIKCGDLNKNGEIDSLDYILLKRAYFGTYKIV